MKLISVNDLSLQNEGYFAFKHVAFSLAQKEIIGISGDNGSGKTQLLEAIANDENIDSGEIRYTPGVRIGYLPQQDPQEIYQTTRKYLEQIRKLSKKLAVRKDQMDAMITYLRLSPYLDRNVNQLSLGTQRKIGFLAAVVGHPNVLLLDEPFIFQTDTTILNMLDMIQDLKDNGSGIIITASQFNPNVEKILTTQYQLQDGRLTSPEKVTTVNLQFRIHINSIAITKELFKYVTSNKNNLLQMQVPANLKDKIVSQMIALNYQFEEVKDH
ncbi:MULTISPECIES: ATP-binding cassette domain-containing protein [unclassified Companilactobacillus]|uniref:ATP-binding cassette domain-containing protein n=1 Tax=unclassified Companilactobacillus TaxID=2767904 RepID=UPI002FEF01B1